eukprot:Platyproteum_vivax@DN6589_c0_g1_i1.p1
MSYETKTVPMSEPVDIKAAEKISKSALEHAEAALEIAKAAEKMPNESTIRATKLVEQIVKDGCPDACDELARLIHGVGPTAFETYDVVTKFRCGASSKDKIARGGVLLGMKALLENATIVSEAHLLSMFDCVLQLAADKEKKNAHLAEGVAKEMIVKFNKYSMPLLVPSILGVLGDQSYKWQSRLLGLSLLHELAEKCPHEVAEFLEELVPSVAACVHDVREQVGKAAESCLACACRTEVLGNKDILPFIPVMLKAVSNPDEIPECVHTLSATTFVQSVERPVMSVMVPILVRALDNRTTAVKRKACLIITNMCKLVEDPANARPFVPKLLPRIADAKDNVSDPECREMAAKAYKVLLSASGSTSDGEIKTGLYDPQSTYVKLVDVLKTVANISDDVLKQLNVMLNYIAATSAFLVQMNNFVLDDWRDCIRGHLVAFMPYEDAVQVLRQFVDVCYKAIEVKANTDDDADEGPDLCNCVFSLGYGGKVLLNQARLHLKRGRRYGLCGPNGVGKSTLMRSIAKGQVEGFPHADELHTVYVEHDLDSSTADLSVFEWLCEDSRVCYIYKENTEEMVEAKLFELGFDEAMQNASLGSLSGGWRMKLALTRAMLLKADILLLDEPTNHLDHKNVGWLIDYLNSLTDVTSVLVSHDSSFLDKVCTDVIHYEGYKLKRYRGNLSAFVHVKPEAAAYYQLSATELSFSFPKPTSLDGVKSKDKAILKMHGVNFTYPGAEKQILKGVSLYCSLQSRVSVVGANGAGKSTCIKILTGELVPCEGNVWKHPNLRVAYVAQHAFHHIEEHLNKTPNEYIQWRFASGEDRELLTKDANALTEAEIKKMQEKLVVNGVKRVIEKIMERRKFKSSYEYLVKFVDCPEDQNEWMKRPELEEAGFCKMVDAVDAKAAAERGAKPLTSTQIAKHLEDVGLESEFTLHSRMAGLSGGQKVKVVLGAAMWLNPHMLVLDEPTNYLDRDSLGALANAIEEFEGGVVIISHHYEFTNQICKETWEVEDGMLTRSGEFTQIAEKVKTDVGPDEMIDAMGNVVKVKKSKKNMSKKELIKARKVKAAARERGEEVSDTEDED